MTCRSQRFSAFSVFREANPDATYDDFLAAENAAAEGDPEAIAETRANEEPRLSRAEVERDRQARRIATADELSLQAARIFELRFQAGRLDRRLCWSDQGLSVAAGVKLSRQERAEIVRTEILAGCHAALVPGRS